MPARITRTAHQWVGAATVVLNDAQASWASRRLSVTVASNTEVPVLEVYCAACRRPWDDVRWLPCEAAETNEHLRGGPSVRAGRSTDDVGEYEPAVRGA